MMVRSRTRNVGLALLYGLATLVVGVGHNHAPRLDGPRAIAQPGCDDPSPHYASHGAPELIRGDLHCPACQFRAEHQAGTSRPVSIVAVVGRPLVLANAPRLRPAAASRPSPRGPPLA